MSSGGLSGGLRDYAVAAAGVLGAILLQFLLAPFTGHGSAFLLNLLAVAFAGWYAGLWPGLLAAILATSAVHIESVWAHDALTAHTTIMSILFLLVAITITVLNSQLHHARQRLESRMAAERQARQHAETEIAERTRSEARLQQIQGELSRAKEAAETINRAKDQFLATLSHELRTPLTPVLMTAAAFEADQTLPVHVRTGMETIHRNIMLQARLIDDLLDLSRIGRGKLAMHQRVMDARNVLNDTIEVCQPDAQAKQIPIDLTLAATRHHLNADPARLQQVFWNLLKNAIKFTPENGRIAITCRNDPAGNLLIEITDTGIGIDPQVLPHLFAAFQQGDPTIARQFGGLGLGLAISKALVEMHGGQISAESAGRNRGSTFRVVLPTAPTPETAAPPSPQAPSPHTAAKPARVLLIEDHPDTARTMAALLKSFGHEVMVAHTVRAALELARDHDFDLVISDLGLPDGSGLDLMRQLKYLHGLKGIALSGYGMEEDLRHSAEAGFLQHLTKPIDIDRLHDAIRYATASDRQPG